jgi:hypothetical protein
LGKHFSSCCSPSGSASDSRNPSQGHEVVFRVSERGLISPARVVTHFDVAPPGTCPDIVGRAAHAGLKPGATEPRCVTTPAGISLTGRGASG